jgi:hypothetical protein
MKRVMAHGNSVGKTTVQRMTAAEYRALAAKEKVRGKNKYGARRVVLDNHSFASALEAKRYQELKLLERAGKILDLTLQPRFPLKIDGQKVGTYVADFLYVELVRTPIAKHECGYSTIGDNIHTAELAVVEDAKGLVLPLYALKRGMFKQLYPGYIFREIRK